MAQARQHGMRRLRASLGQRDIMSARDANDTRAAKRCGSSVIAGAKRRRQPLPMPWAGFGFRRDCNERYQTRRKPESAGAVSQIFLVKVVPSGYDLNKGTGSLSTTADSSDQSTNDAARDDDSMLSIEVGGKTIGQNPEAAIAAGHVVRRPDGKLELAGPRARPISLIKAASNQIAIS